VDKAGYSSNGKIALVEILPLVANYISCYKKLSQLCRTHCPRASCGPAEGFLCDPAMSNPQIFFSVVKVSILLLTTCLILIIFYFDIFDVGVPQCHYMIMSVTNTIV